jgi:hypothetical protein
VAWPPRDVPRTSLAMLIRGGVWSQRQSHSPSKTGPLWATLILSFSFIQTPKNYPSKISHAPFPAHRRIELSSDKQSEKNRHRIIWSRIPGFVSNPFRRQWIIVKNERSQTCFKVFIHNIMCVI